jgi:hypothetical protein
MHKASRILLLWGALMYQSVLATEERVADIELLEFLGTIAGLESMGVDIDLLLNGLEVRGDELVSDGENDE